MMPILLSSSERSEGYRFVFKWEKGGGETMVGDLSNRERQLLLFLRRLGWGEVRIRVENGQPVMIYEAIRTCKLDDEPERLGEKNRRAPKV